VCLKGAYEDAAFQITPSRTTVTAGSPLTDFTVAVVDAQGYRVINYTGTVHFSSTDPRFSMPDYTFLASDHGAHDFHNMVTLFTAGPEGIFVGDFANSLQAISNLTVLPGAINNFKVTTPSTAIHDVAFNVTVTAQDAFQNTVGSYAGTVRFASSDSSASHRQRRAYI